jgi:two-component system, response regulator
VKNKDILLVEDNPDDVELTRRAFRKCNLVNELIVARDGVEALECLFGTEENAGMSARELPAIVLLDLKLPRIDGLEVLRRLRENPRTRYVPVVIMTSSKEEQDLVDGYRLGCNSYICKPVDFVQFARAVEQLGMYWLLLNEQAPSPENPETTFRR